MIDRMVAEDLWDVIVIGGGATGLGTAVDAASRGYRTLLLEQGDFAQGTSSRSTKLIHGGVRYLQQGNLSLVLEALHERGLLLANAPHLVHHQAFLVPAYEWWEGPFFGIGLKFYDALAGKLGLGPSKRLSGEQVLEKIPTLNPNGLRGGIIYYDGQFDDARLSVTLARTLADLGGCAVNYMPVTRLVKKDRFVDGVGVRDALTEQEYKIKGQVVINATGIFVDSIRRMDDPETENLLAPSQGIHIVLDQSFLPGETAIMVPHTDDGRVFFAVPWHGRVIVGTTDTPVRTPRVEPHPKPDEIDFLLSHAARYLTDHPTRRDLKSVFAGIRPLIQSDTTIKTAALSRDHHVMVSPTGLITVAGGKWTTYRKMGEDAINMAVKVGGLAETVSGTKNLRLHGWQPAPPSDAAFPVYGTDAKALRELIQAEPGLDCFIHPNLPYRMVEIIWAVRYEMAVTLADVLARRLRAIVLDARAAKAAAPRVAGLMAKEMGKDAAWQTAQIASFQKLAGHYLADGH
ncbi:MAG: glycerol-3-phosphate dehydrogenase/oxidase [Deltaproteobacteria bacterium]|nr:glycerol-3-phosphate dehydrogenase/oxidase [Deltaproteobacteria bacterium]